MIHAGRPARGVFGSGNIPFSGLLALWSGSLHMFRRQGLQLPWLWSLTVSVTPLFRFHADFDSVFLCRVCEYQSGDAQ